MVTHLSEAMTSVAAIVMFADTNFLSLPPWRGGRFLRNVGNSHHFDPV